MTNTVPTITVDVLETLTDKRSFPTGLCHLYGIFLYEENLNPATPGWQISDESCPEGVRIKINGDLATYPKPKPGDVIRIHRLSWDKMFGVPVVLTPNNVIVWSAFVYNPTPITTAKRPTIKDEDEHRRRCLETFYCSSFDKINTIKSQPYRPMRFYRIAGQVVQNERDTFGNCLLLIEDETGRFNVRIFNKQQFHEVTDHFDLAKDLKPGQLVAINSMKLDNKMNLLNLSANLRWGRSLRLLGENSILYVQLRSALDELNLRIQNNAAPPPEVNILESPSYEEIPPVTIEAPVAAIQLRRSPRLNQQQETSMNTIGHDVANNTSTSLDSDQGPAVVIQPSPTRQANTSPNKDEQWPEYTTLADVSKISKDRYHYYNVAGQIRGTPCLTQYKHMIFQLYDGSKLDGINCHTEQVVEPLTDCVTVLVYAPQKPGDTDQHIEKLKTLCEGDLILIKNVRACWRYNRLKLDLSANLAHGKSINLIEKDSSFGIKLLDIVTNPFVDDLKDDQFYSTPPDSPMSD